MQNIRFVNTEFEALGIEYLSAVLKKAGHKVDMVSDFNYILSYRFNLVKKIFRYQDKILKMILKGKPDLLAFSVTCNNIEWAYMLADKIKNISKVPIVFGGVQATLIPETVIKKEFVDFVVVGEGELAILDLVNSLESKKPDYSIKNVWFKNNGQIIKNYLRRPIDDLDTLPFPDKELFQDNFSSRYNIITSRGCIYHCTYCCAPFLTNIYGDNIRSVRRRSPKNVIAELRKAKERYSPKKIIFEDDLFTYDRKWLKEFSAMYENQIAIPCALTTHPSCVDDEIVSLLKQMNCRAVEVGIQSINEEIRRVFLKRYYSNEQVKNILMLLNKNDILCTVDNIIGLPGEQEKDIKEMIRFYNEIRPGKIDIFYLKYFPKTEISKMAGLGEDIRNKIDNGDYPSSNSVALFNCDDIHLLKIDVKKTNKLIALTVLMYILPKRLVDYILKKNLYRFFPYITNIHFVNELVFFSSSVFKKYRYAAIILSREERIRRVHFTIKTLLENIF